MAYQFIASQDQTIELQEITQQQSFINDNVDADPTSNVDNCCDVDCCESECICPANICTSFVYLTANHSMLEIVALRESSLSPAEKNTRYIATSLYRPPIFSS